MTLTLTIIAAALATYLTRVGGHLIMLGFGKLGPRAEAALDAVPVAVLTAIVVPAVVGRGPAEVVALVAAGLVGLKLAVSWVVLIGLVVLVVARSTLG